MVDSARQLLDELMGRNRNVDLALSIRQIDWTDTEYCQYYLVNFCPHDLFVNTRADLGACTKLHDDEAKRLFQEARPSIKKKQHEDEFLRFCSNMINECDRKIHKGKQRLLLMNKSAEGNTPPVSKHQEQINILNDRIKKLVNEAEEAGIRGDVEQAQGLMKLCDQLKEEKDVLTSNKAQKDSHWSFDFIQAQEKQMEVCEVCGAFLIIGDAQQRIDDHLTGKQHLGYSKLRKVADEMYETRRKKRDEDIKKRDDRNSHRAENGGPDRYRAGSAGGADRYHHRRDEFEDRRRNDRGGMERRDFRGGHRGDSRPNFRFHDKSRHHERSVDPRESHREQRYRGTEDRGSPRRRSRSRSRTH